MGGILPVYGPDLTSQHACHSHVRALNLPSIHGQACLRYFEKAKAHDYAKEVLLKLGDIQGLLQLNLEANKWNDALQLIEIHPEYAPQAEHLPTVTAHGPTVSIAFVLPQVYLPYAQWLVENDRFEEAQEAYKAAGQSSKSLELLRTLTHNAVLENRYEAAGHYLWLLAKETLMAVGERPTNQARRAWLNGLLHSLA